MLKVLGISKKFPGVVALSEVDFRVGAGQIVGLIGENGAGKSTLIKILAGIYQPDSGQILLNGTPAQFKSPVEAMNSGISVVHQELSSLENLDVAANLFLGRERRKYGVLANTAQMQAESHRYLDRVGLNVVPSTPVQLLSIAQRQQLEIAKSLVNQASVLIFDEPTSSLTLQETERLLALLKSLRAEGKAIVYVSHRLDEVQEISDEVTVLRDGSNAGDLAAKEVSKREMIRLMVGRDISEAMPSKEAHIKPVLKVSGLKTRRYPGHEINFEVCSGEVVGIAGLVGSGRTELVESICGMSSRVAGTIQVDDAQIGAGVVNAIESGLFLAPEDRKKNGLISSMEIAANLTLPKSNRFTRLGLLSQGAERAYAEPIKQKMRIKASSLDTMAHTLSGGNQQKIVLGKWLGLNPKVLVLDEPTRGIDVGAREEVYELIEGLKKQGVAILMVSSDMEEILRLSNRILVLHEGKCKAVLERSEATQENIMQLATGGTA
jgi:ribose transport system ATP-binding protein